MNDAQLPSATEFINLLDELLTPSRRLISDLVTMHAAYASEVGS